MENYSPHSTSARHLRLIALVGVASVMTWQMLTTDLRPRQAVGLYILAAAVPAVWLLSRSMMPRALSRLSRHRDVLVPLGLCVTANAAVGLLLALPALAALQAPTWTLKLLAFSVPLSAGFIMQVVLAMVYAGWTTALVTQSVILERVYLVESLKMMRRWFWRTLALEVIGWGVPTSLVLLMLAAGQYSLGPAMLLAVLTLVWNVSTAALLAATLAEAVPFGEAVRRGMRASWAGAGKWWVFVVVQMFVLGWLTFVSVTFSTGSEVKQVSNWSVHAFWVGGYPDTFHWYGELMKASESEPLPLISTALTLLFGCFAIVVKLTVVEGLYEPPPEPARPGVEL